VYSIDRVFRVQQTMEGESIREFRPFYSLRHDDLAGAAESDGGCYWHAHRDELSAQQSPGYEIELSLVDAQFDPAHPSIDTLSIDISATNRDLPATLPVGTPGGDLFVDGGGVAREIRLLRKPTPTYRFARGRGALWRLISHLSLNHLSLSAGGVDALKEMLRLYDVSNSASNRRQIDGIISIDFKPTNAWIPGRPFATFVRGTEVRVKLEESSFVGSGLHLFAAVLERFFALYVHANSFTQLVVESARTQEEIVRCLPRNGDGPLA
jgi:type VI secretion system protein ImpG